MRYLDKNRGKASPKQWKLFLSLSAVIALIAYLNYIPAPKTRNIVYSNQGNNCLATSETFSLGDMIYVNTDFGSYAYRNGKTKWIPFARLNGMENEDFWFIFETPKWLEAKKLTVYRKSDGKTMTKIENISSAFLYQNTVFYLQIEGGFLGGLYAYNLQDGTCKTLIDSEEDVYQFFVYNESTLLFTKYDKPEENETREIFLLQDGEIKQATTVTQSVHSAFWEDNLFYYCDYKLQKVYAYDVITSKRKEVYSGNFEDFQNVYDNILYFTRIIDEKTTEIFYYDMARQKEFTLGKISPMETSREDYTAYSIYNPVKITVLGPDELIVSSPRTVWYMKKDTVTRKISLLF